MRIGIFVVSALSFFIVTLHTLGAAENLFPLAREAPSAKVFAVTRPSQTDVQTIETVARLGAPTEVNFPRGASVRIYAATKCGRPSATTLVHPAYEKILLEQNPGLSVGHLDSLPTPMTIRLPACAVFADSPPPQAVANSVSNLTLDKAVPFDTRAFYKIVDDESLRTQLQKTYASYNDVFQKMTSYGEDAATDKEVTDVWRPVKTAVNAAREKCSLKGVPQYADFACVNAIEIVASNPNITKPGKITGDIKIPAPTPRQAGIDRIPLSTDIDPQAFNAARAGATQIAPNLEDQLKFVTAVKVVEQYGPACANADEKMKGRWPFDLVEFQRIMSLNGIFSNSNTFGKILVVDTGFDFIKEPDSTKEQATRVALAFPEQYFARTGQDPYDPKYPNRDINNDTVPGNKGWAGANIAAVIGKRSAQSSVVDENRSHGLSVLTLALGGRGLEAFRRLAPLPVRVGDVSLVPLDTLTIRLDRGHVERAFQYATAPGNEFDVVNYSLTSPEKITGLDSVLNQSGRGVTIVAAAGNDNKELKGTDLVWPAGSGGQSTGNDNVRAQYITVGAHDAEMNRAGFSNWGAAVDLLAPGCAVPSYELTPDGKLKESAVSGTSFAAPIVAFVAATLASRDPFHRQPGRIKSRILVSTDFNYNPRLITYSSGTLNVAKTLGYPFDMVEVTRGEGRKLYYGTVSNKGEIAPIECNGRAIEFKEIRKIARSRSPSDYVLIFSTEDDGNPSVLKRDFCPTSSIGNVTVKFTDFETGDEMSFGASEIQDYVPSVGG